MNIIKSKAGPKAFKVSKVWQLGFHLFKTTDDIILRLCYFRNKKATYYCQISLERRKVGENEL